MCVCECDAPRERERETWPFGLLTSSPLFSVTRYEAETGGDLNKLRCSWYMRSSMKRIIRGSWLWGV